MNDAFKTHLQQQINEISESGLYKAEHPLTTAQGVRVEVEGQEERALSISAQTTIWVSLSIRRSAMPPYKAFRIGDTA